jgi:hypothetical protein
LKFIDTSSAHDSLYHYTLFLLGKNVTDTTSFTVADWMRSANIYYRKAAYYIWKNTNGWEFDDSNYSTLPVATSTLVDQQQDYTIPTDALDIQRVEILDNSGNYQLLDRINKETVTEAMTNFFKTPAMPRYYDMVGNSILLYPAPAAANVTLSQGIKIYTARDVSTVGTPWVYRQMSQTPGFQIDFHPYIAIGAALDYGVSKNFVKEKMDNLKAVLQENQQNILDYYARRDRDYPVKFRPSPRGSV